MDIRKKIALSAAIAELESDKLMGESDVLPISDFVDMIYTFFDPVEQSKTQEELVKVATNIQKAIVDYMKTAPEEKYNHLTSKENKLRIESLGKAVSDIVGAPHLEPEFVPEIITKPVDVPQPSSSSSSSSFGDMVGNVLNAAGGMMGKKKKDKCNTEDDCEMPCMLPEPMSQITFDNIAGQEAVKNDIRMNYIYPFQFPGLFKEKSKGVLFYGPPGTGKCLGPDVEVMMYDGTFKKACHIRPYDVLMGDDSTPRQVFTITTGVDDMYNIIPMDGYGEPFTVNEPHIMSLLKKSSPTIEAIPHGYKVMWYENGHINAKFFKGIDPSTKATAEYFYQTRKYVYDIEDIPLNEFLEMRKTERRMYSGFRVGVEWDEQPTPTPPFECGKALYHSFAHTIPKEYLINSKSRRIELLAGFLTAYGYDTLTLEKYEVKSEIGGILAELMVLARSVGLNAKMRSKNKLILHTTQWCSSLDSSSPSRPGRTYPNTFSFKVTYIGKGRYFGFTIGGNRRFLLKDFTVTHNTLLAKAATRSIAGAAFFAPTAGEMKGKYEGETEKQIRALFRCAGEIVGTYSPSICGHVKTSIIFIDEAEALIGDRKKYGEGMTRTTNTFLQCMDGLKSYPDVSVIAATNYPWVIDSAIERRFSEKIFVDKPDVKAIKWLVEDALKRLFLPPGLTATEKASYDNFSKIPKDLERIYSIMNIHKTGGYCDDRTIERKGKSKSSRRQPTMAHRHKVMTKQPGMVYGEKDVEVEVGSGISPQFIDYIVKKLSHSPEMGVLIEKIKRGERVTEVDLADKDKLRVGYSGSDIAKVMSIAAKTCSAESMHGLFQPTKFWVRYKIYDISSEEVMQKMKATSPFTFNDIISYYEYSGKILDTFLELNRKTATDTVTGNVTMIDTYSKKEVCGTDTKSVIRDHWREEEYFVHIPFDFQSGIKYYRMGKHIKLDKSVKIKLSDKQISTKTLMTVPSERYVDCISFSLCPGHIRLAIRKYPPTIQLKPYLNLLRYKYQGIDAVEHDEE